MTKNKDQLKLFSEVELLSKNNWSKLGKELENDFLKRLGLKPSTKKQELYLKYIRT